MADVLLTERAKRDLRGLDEQTRQRLLSKIREYAEDPFHHARKLSNPIIGEYRFRIGDWRVVFDVEGENLVVLRIGNRRDIYR